MKKNTLGHLYKDGEIIIKQNTLGNSLYVIQEGKLIEVRPAKLANSYLA